MFRKQNGNTYEGEYKYDKCEGFGVYRFNSGDKYEGMWKNSLKSGQGTISWSTGRKFEGRFADDCPIIGKLIETDGKVYSVTYDGTQKFGNGAKPASQKLIRTNSPRPNDMEAELRQESSQGTTTTTGRQDASTAPARTAPELPTPPTSSAPAAGAARLAAAGASATWAASESKVEGGAEASKADEWDPFADIAASVAEAATVPAGGKTASDVWDLFGPDPVRSKGQGGQAPGPAAPSKEVDPIKQVPLSNAELDMTIAAVQTLAGPTSTLDWSALRKFMAEGKASCCLAPSGGARERERDLRNQSEEAAREASTLTN